MREIRKTREKLGAGTAVAFLSFFFFHLTRLALHILQRGAMSLLSRRALEWRVLGPEVLNQPLALPVIMTTGPRWNPHAIIATAGPIAVDGLLAIDLGSADASTALWTVVVHRFPNFYPVASAGASSGVSEIHVKPGRYVLAFRYYEWGREPQIPALVIDGKRSVPGRRLGSSPNAFYKDLHLRGGFFYRCLHYYVFEMLRLRDRLPESFVRRQYLPARNPETQFDFGIVRQEKHVDLRAAHALLPTHAVYLTIYNRDSFPVYWCRVTESADTSPAAAADGFYLIRSHAREARGDRAAAASL